ncbi:MerR family transcriptional regulator [Paenibacillus sp. MZ04-78.2]|uniref:MerR family transcriptional regulator n=1 Tax=Paenibacillus sp. MZ04-78.2 TaxID=2962034 RepID=UPI0020B73502|nr:MerR family transcriptional regulator [Paenibacillus sp. MZ04-78.2]MCP3775050.1 MerR family transcriptional regulator [Paenibacillus sp. MZ04-78.2]
MYKIGEFSKINKISQRMLRYYDEKALLTPKKDELNGYRYYTNDDIEIVNRIKLLRKYHFSMDEIKNVLDMDSKAIKALYQQKIAELNEKAMEYTHVIEEMKKVIEPANPIMKANAYDVLWGVRKPFHALCLRRVVDADDLELLMNELDASVNEMNLMLTGKHFAIFHSIEEKDFYRYDVEVVQPIGLTTEVKDARIKLFEETNYICTVHIGNYDHISYAYSALYDWAHSNGYHLEGPFIEKYYADEFVTLDKDAFVTEVGIAIKTS